MIQIFPDGIIPLWAFILSQILGLITAVLVFYTFAFIGTKAKVCHDTQDAATIRDIEIGHQKKNLLFMSVWATTWFFMFLFLGQMTGMLLSGFAAIRNVVFWAVVGSKNPKVQLASKIILLVSLIIGVIGAILPPFIFDAVTFQWYDFVVLIAATLFIISTWIPNKHILRGATVFYAAWLIVLAAMIVNVDIRMPGGDITNIPNIMGILIEVIKIGAVVVFYYMWFFKGKRDPIRTKSGAVAEQTVQTTESPTDTAESA